MDREDEGLTQEAEEAVWTILYMPLQYELRKMWFFSLRIMGLSFIALCKIDFFLFLYCL